MTRNDAKLSRRVVDATAREVHNDFHDLLMGDRRVKERDIANTVRISSKEYILF